MENIPSAPEPCLWVGLDSRSTNVKERWRMLNVRIHVALGSFCTGSYPRSPPGGVSTVGDVYMQYMQ